MSAGVGIAATPEVPPEDIPGLCAQSPAPTRQDELGTHGHARPSVSHSGAGRSTQVHCRPEREGAGVGCSRVGGRCPWTEAPRTEQPRQGRPRHTPPAMPATPAGPSRLAHWREPSGGVVDLARQATGTGLRRSPGRSIPRAGAQTPARSSRPPAVAAACGTATAQGRRRAAPGANRRGSRSGAGVGSVRRRSSPGRAEGAVGVGHRSPCRRVGQESRRAQRSA